MVVHHCAGGAFWSIDVVGCSKTVDVESNSHLDGTSQEVGKLEPLLTILWIFVKTLWIIFPYAALVEL